jgi:hypothetical protein
MKRKFCFEKESGLYQMTSFVVSSHKPSISAIEQVANVLSCS